MFSKAEMVSEVVPVQYHSGDREFRLVFSVSIGVALSKINRTAVFTFVGEPMLRINLDDLEQEVIFYVYMSLREEIKRVATQLVENQYGMEGVFFIIPQYN